jgi:hypothetical protein
MQRSGTSQRCVESPCLVNGPLGVSWIRAASLAPGRGGRGDDLGSGRDRSVAIWCFWTPVDAAGEDVSGELVEPVAERMGRPFKPSRVVRVRALPRTRSAKILPGAVRVVATGADPGDLLGAENPEALEVLYALAARL